jgi:alkaline phosphatase D
MFNRFVWLLFVALGVQTTPANQITHGPVLGRPGMTTMSVWVRTKSPAAVQVRYASAVSGQAGVSAIVATRLDGDNTAVMTLANLKPDTRYNYRVDTVPPGSPRSGTFRTLPDGKDFANAAHNPTGLFNFSFEVGCCNNQRHAEELKVPLKTYETMNREILDQVRFAIQNGDWLYEEKREFTVPEWQTQTGTPDSQLPRILQLSPAVAGVWENYKLYWERAPHLRKWHSQIPTFFTVDDHELVNDIYGCATPGFRNRRAVFRDPAMKAWFDYLAWANPQEHAMPAHFGTARLEADSDVLVDAAADFTKLPLSEMATLHIHFGGYLAGVKNPEPDPKLGDPNHGVYRIEEVLDAHRVRISPKPLATRNSVYSIGRRTYGRFRVANCEFFLIDTRTHRDLHDVTTPADPDRSMLGEAQLAWLMNSMKESDADFFFVASTVNFMVPHVGAGGSELDRNQAAGKDDAWTVFLHEREKLIRFWTDEIKRPVFVITGDLHNSFAIKVTDSVWEFASAPHNSPNHRSAVDAGGLPIQGKFQYGPRACDVRWSTYVMEDIPREHRRFPNYCVVQVNNVFDNPLTPDTHRWVAFPKPYVMFQFFDGNSGDLKYVETIHARTGSAGK